MNIDEKFFEDKGMSANGIDDVLDADERVLWRDGPDKKAHVAAAVVGMLPVAILWLAFDGAFIGGISYGMSQGAVPLAILGFIIPFFLIHLTPVWIWISRVVKATAELKNTEYAFTDRRIIVRSGVIGIDFTFLNYNEIQSVNVKVGITDRLFKVGDIHIAANDSSVVLCDLHNPYKLGSKLQKVVRDVSSDLHFPNSLRTRGNSGYHTAYDDDPFTNPNSKEREV